MGRVSGTARNLIGAAVCALALLCAPTGAASGPVPGYGELPLVFEPNRGQTDERVAFLSRGRGYALFLTETEAVLSLEGGPEGGRVLRIALLGGAPKPKIIGLERRPGVSNYFIGRDRSKWRSGVPHYAKVGYEEIYPGIDLVFYGTAGRRLEYDFIVAPGADPSRIALGFEGAERLELDQAGDLVARLPGGSLRFRKPEIYQGAGDTRRLVEGGYVLTDQRVTFELAAYDATKPLVIDPILEYATYLGGSDSEERVHSIAVDRDGNAYIAGRTRSTDFPIVGAVQDVCVETEGTSSCHEAFVAKLNPAGSDLVYSTYLGGASLETAWAIAVNQTGNVYVAGGIDSSDAVTDDFPTTIGAFRESALSADDAFFTKLGPDGGLAYSTYLGGERADIAYDIAVGPMGGAYLVGWTGSDEFPTTSGAVDAWCGDDIALYNDCSFATGDAFLTVIDPAGNADLDLRYSTFFGGTGDDNAGGVTVDDTGVVYIAGSTGSEDFPVTAGAVQNFLFAFGAAFLAVIDPDPEKLGSDNLLYSTYFGGDGSTGGLDVALVPGCRGEPPTDLPCPAYLLGGTNADNLPTTENGIAPSPVEEYGGFLTIIEPDNEPDNADPLSNVAYSSYLGPVGSDFSVDSTGLAYIAGPAPDRDRPTRDAIQSSAIGGQDAFVSVVDPAGIGLDGLRFGTFLGGTNDEMADAAAVGPHDDAPEGAVYLSGSTWSRDFPTTAGAFQPELSTAETSPSKRKGPPILSPVRPDAFVAKIAGPFDGTAEVVGSLTPKPVAEADFYEIDEDVTLSIPALGVLGNDGGLGEDLSVSSVGKGPAHGALTMRADGSFEYTPDPDFTGVDRFQYNAQGSQGADDTLVRITVTASNDPPVAKDDGYRAPAPGETLVVESPGVLRNDRDAEDDPLTAALEDRPLHGAVTLGNYGGFSYTAYDTFPGIDSFTYVANDGTKDSNVATVWIGSLHIGDVVVRAEKRGSSWDASIDLNVHDQGENPAAEARIRGTWAGTSGSEQQQAVCTTKSMDVSLPDSDETRAGAWCRVSIAGVPNKISSVTYRIVYIDLKRIVYVPGDNHDPDGDIAPGNGSIDVSKP